MAGPVPKVTQEELKHVLYYDEFTGIFTWIRTNSNRRKAGSRAGSVETKGHGKAYVYIRVNNKCYRGHTLAHLYMTGKWPPVGVKSPHLNHDGLDNRWENLQDGYDD